MEKKEIQKIGDIFSEAKNRIGQGSNFLLSQKKKAPAHQWQDFALRIIAELDMPAFKRSAVFKVCKDKPRHIVERCLNETKELCKTGDRFKYFFKLIAESSKINK